jgi:hypothetical protein
MSIEYFLEIANKAIQGFPGEEGKDYFQYMKNTKENFLIHIKKFTTEDVLHAIHCIETNQWDQSEFIMAFEGA